MVFTFEREKNPELGKNGKFKYQPEIIVFNGQHLPSNHIITHSGRNLIEGDQIGYVRGNLGILYWIHQSVVVKSR